MTNNGKNKGMVATCFHETSTGEVVSDQIVVDESTMIPVGGYSSNEITYIDDSK